MNLADRNTKTETPPYVPSSISSCPILVVDRDNFCAHKYKHRLLRGGFERVSTVETFDAAAMHLGENRCDLIFVGTDNSDNRERSLDFLASVRQHGYRGIICMLYDIPTLQHLFRAANLGADDILVKGKYLNVVHEASVQLGRTHYVNSSVFRHDAAHKTGFFRSLGMTRGELDILVEFANGFPKQRELAERLDKSHAQLHKAFSRIYRKLDDGLEVNNPAKLSFLLTICSFFRI